MSLLVGGVIVALASILGGATGFGFGLVSTPLLLLSGFSLPFVVTANLTLGLVTRVSAVVRLRAHVTWRRAALLIAGSIPGLYLGARMLTGVDPRPLKIAVGVLVTAAALLLARARGTIAPRPIPGAVVVAGFGGGFLGGLASLGGVAPALLLTRDRVRPLALIADLATYFVASHAIGLAMLGATGGFSTRALMPACVLWAPGALAGNLLGVTLAHHVPDGLFRRLTIGVVVAAGIVTIATSY
jgi:uncharacterized protein